MSNQYSQQNFVIYEIQLPYCTVCTPVDGLTQSFHTPVTCEESSDATYSLFLTSNKTPALVTQGDLGFQAISTKSQLNSKIFKQVDSASESTAKLKAGEGMASRGTLSIACSDFDGDPGPITFTESGTFFGKLMARNVLQNKKILSHYCTIAKNPTTKTNELTIEETHTHFIDDVQLTGGKFTLKAKDALKDIEAFGQKFPAISEIELTSNIDSSQVVIPVNDATLLSAGSVFRIEEELFYVNSKAGNNVTVAARGAEWSNGPNVVYKTRVSEHSSGSTVQPCYVMNNRFLSNVFQDIFNAVGLSSYVDFTQWNDEISTWTSQAYNFGVWSEPKKVSEILDKLCKQYLIDMWLDQPTQKVKVSATTAWKQAIRIFYEGNDIQDLKIKQDDNKRFSRCFAYTSKEYKAENDDVINFGRLISASDIASESSDLYGKVKEKDLGKSDVMTTGSTQTTVSRYVQRFSRAPKEITFSIEERKLGTTSVSDIVDIVSRDTQTPSGEYLQARDRAQILRIQPVLNDIGRRYTVSALSYIPLIGGGGVGPGPGGELVITLSGSLIDVNLYSRAGAPANAVNVTFIFDGCTIGSSEGVPAVRAGAWPVGSVIKIICTNGTKWSAKGGNASTWRTSLEIGAEILVKPQSNGSDSYQSDGVETHIYLNYGTVDSYTTSSELYAAGGAGATPKLPQPYPASPSLPWSGGGGGSGIPFGEGGKFEYALPGFPVSKAYGNDGSFNTGGSGATHFSGLQLEARGGDGGFSVNGGNSVSNNGNFDEPTLAGGAFKGSSITVYNLSSESSKLRDGNSDAYTLITA